MSIHPKRTLSPVFLLIFALLPALTTWSGFYLEFFPYLIYPVAKLIMALAPFMVWRIYEGGLLKGLGRMGLERPSWRGVASGILLSAAIYAIYTLFFADIDVDGIRVKLTRLGIIEYYWLASFCLFAFNSALEEWYWRGFLVDEFRNHVKHPAVIIGAGGFFFGLHHYFTLLPYFPINVILIFTFATMLVGALWCWQRLQGWSLTDCYLSHLAADLTIIAISSSLLF